VFGNVVCFAELNRELGPDQPFYGLQSVGLDGSEPPLQSIEDMAELYIDEICSVQPCGPYVLSGACFGATVAYEMARQLLAAGEEVAFVGLLDPTRREANDRCGYQLFSARALRRATALKHLVSTRWHLYLREISQAKGKGRTEFLTRKLRSLAGLVTEPNRVKAVQRELNQIEVYRANVAALNRYERKPLTGKLRAVEIFHTARHSSSQWKILWSGSTVRHLMPGKDSGDLLTGSNVKTLAPLLAERLSQSLERKTAK
jgi:thioesterase domain-containing protein